MPLTIATWNVNSVRKRLDHVARLVRETDIDVLCLQETKVVDALFPSDDIAAMGFPHQAIHGMKGYNGVAILSRVPLDTTETISWLKRDDCRHIHARALTPGGPIEVHSLYIPAGGDDPNPETNPKFAHKLAFLDALGPFCEARARSDLPVVLTGDFNVAPLETDVWSHQRLKRVITHTPVEREALTGLLNSGGAGWTDALRRFIPAEEKAFTWWSYRAADWQAANKGRRLDHIWANRALSPALTDARILQDVRGWSEPSDHAPVVAQFDIS